MNWETPLAQVTVAGVLGTVLAWLVQAWGYQVLVIWLLVLLTVRSFWHPRKKP